jgi:hypothetical protein
MTEWEGGARFFARAVHEDVDLSDFQDNFLKPDGSANFNLVGVTTQLWRDIGHKLKFTGKLTVGDELGLDVSRAMLGEYAQARQDSAKRFAQMLGGEEEFMNCVAYWCGDTLGADWQQVRKGLE